MERKYTLVSVGKPYTLSTPAHTRYPDIFGTQITDGQKTPLAGAHYVDSRMVGFLDDCSFTIDLGEDGKSICAIAARGLCMNQHGVAIPATADFAGSVDGEEFIDLGSESFPANMEKTVSVIWKELDETADFRYIRVTIHKTSWANFFFTDEIEVYADIDEKELPDRVSEVYADESICRADWKKLSTGNAAKYIAGANIAAGKKYSFANCGFDERAPQNDIYLTDNAHVGSLFGQPFWVGIKSENENRPEIILDLGESFETIYALKLHSIGNAPKMEYAPYVDYFGSEDGKDFVFLGRVYSPQQVDQFTYTLLFPEFIKARYLKFAFPKSRLSYWFEEIQVMAGFDEPLEAELFGQLSLPIIENNEYWDNSEPDYNQEKNLLLGLPQQISSSFYVDKLQRPDDTGAEFTGLTDGKQAQSPEEWFYNQGGEALDFFYDLGKVSAVSKFKVSVLENIEKGLPRPDHITVMLSEDATSWYNVAKFDRKWMRITVKDKNKADIVNSEGSERVLFELESEKPYGARFVRFRIEIENGILLDELEAYGTKNAENACLISESGIKGYPFYTNIATERYGTTENTIVKAKNINLFYNGGAAEESVLPYVAYLDEDGNIKDTFMDGFLFIPMAPLPSGHVCYAENDMKDWLFICEDTFSCSCGMDKVEEALEKTKAALNKPDYKVQAYITLPTPRETVTEFGDIDGDGIIENLSVKAHREKVIRWFIDMCEKTFKEKNYKHIELAGFYWVEETAAWTFDDTHVIKEAGEIVHDMGYQYIWIPYYCSHRFFLADELGFDFVSMQPNYTFSIDLPFYKVTSCAKYTRQRGYSVEIEHSYQALSDPAFARKYMLYLLNGKTLGYIDSIHAYYNDRENFALMAYSKDPLHRMQYDATYHFAKGDLETVPAPRDAVSFNIPANTVFRGNLNEDSAISNYTLVASPEHGAISLTFDGRFVYCPEKGFTGRDVFKYTYNNYLAESDECIVEIIVD